MDKGSSWCSDRVRWHNWRSDSKQPMVVGQEIADGEEKKGIEARKIGDSRLFLHFFDLRPIIGGQTFREKIVGSSRVKNRGCSTVGGGTGGQKKK